MEVVVRFVSFLAEFTGDKEPQTAPIRESGGFCEVARLGRGDGLVRDLIEAGLNEPRVAGSGYGDCVAAAIRHGERAPWVDGGEAMAACVRA